MAGPSRNANEAAGNTTGARPDPGSPPRTPRWVKAFGIIAVIVLIALGVIEHLPSLGGMVGHHS